MPHQRWTNLSYSKDMAIPLVGEIILLRYPIGLIPFPYGPTSVLAPSSNTSRTFNSFPTTVTGNPKHVKATMHYVLVFSASHNTQKGVVDLVFMPIMSYSSPPSRATKSTWDPDRWMSLEAPKASQLHHLPIPAVGWMSVPSVSPLAPILSFGGWLNTRRSWLAMVFVSHAVSDVHMVTPLRLPFHSLLISVCQVVSTSRWPCSSRRWG